MLQPDSDSVQTRSLHVTAAEGEKKSKAFFSPAQERVEVGFFQVVICASCGYTEWYANDFDHLKELQHRPELGVRLVNSDPGDTKPYR